MKAAIIFQKGGMPQYTEDFPEPVSNGNNEIVISVKASAIKNLDKSRASGQHYSSVSELSQARVPGGDGVGILEDGSRVFAMGISGMIAEKAIIDRRRTVSVPEDIDDETAAALPNAVAGSAMAILFRAKLQPGETVLINGATGFTGKIAVQLARHYGAGKVIVTGRNEHTLKALLDLGADEIITLKQSDEDIVARLRKLHEEFPVSVVLDYLWGHTAELILEALKGKGDFTRSTRFVSIGAMAGDTITLSSEILRSVDLQLSGSGLGSWSREEMQLLFREILPEMYQLVIRKQLRADTISFPIQDIEKIWTMEVPDGNRLVVSI